jgi:Fe-S-cluster-containing hydrogenase component 2
MALEIVESCVNCWACLPLCPNKAIFEAKPTFLIDADKCTECIGDHAKAQCVEICPIEGAIVNELNEPMNPPGSLTGIPPARWAAAQREIASR